MLKAGDLQTVSACHTYSFYTVCVNIFNAGLCAAAARAVESKQPKGLSQDKLVCELLNGSEKSQELQATIAQVSCLISLRSDHTACCCFARMLGLTPIGQ